MKAPRKLVHAGSVLASGYVLDDLAHKRAHVLSHWKPGQELFSWPNHRLVWRLTEPERVHCSAAPGLPLVDDHGTLTSFPLDADDRVPGAVLVTLEAGERTTRPLVTRVDPATWLDTSTFTLLAATPLGEPPPPPVLSFEPRKETTAREAFGMPALSADAEAALEAMRNGRPPPEPDGAARERPITIGPVARGLINGLRAVSNFFSRLLPRRAPSPAPSTALGPPRRGLLDRLDAWLARALDTSRLSRLLGQRQADYVARLMQMFEQGDLDAALRHAIPLSNRDPTDAARSLSLPTPRSSLDIRLGPNDGGAASIALQADYFERLRARYRAAAEKLEAEGRYDEAAFVLAELLGAEEEAVALLERHGRLDLAAELAEARRMPPGLQVRQWFLAKRIDRAVAVARRHGVFADAISRLERSKHDTEARQLRLVWADAQASSGDFYNAVLTVWPLADTRPLAQRWVELGIAQGGLTAARLKVKRLALAPEPAAVNALLFDLDSDDAERAGERALITVELETESARLDAAHARSLARASLRAQLRDAAVVPAARLANLHRLAADGALKADLPPGRTPDIALKTRATALRREIAEHDRGALAVEDAALLPDGRMLLALGETGTRLVTRDGRTVAHFEVPASALVPYDSGGRALVLARRGEALLVSRLDLLEQRVETLPRLRLVSACDSTDGSLWFVFDGQSVVALDLHDPQLRALWRVAVLAGQRPKRDALSLSFAAMSEAQTLELWRYELPSLTLRARETLNPPPETETMVVLADGSMVSAMLQTARYRARGSNQDRIVVSGRGAIEGVDGGGGWGSLFLRDGRGVHRWLLFDTEQCGVRHELEVPTRGARVRLDERAAVYFDVEGRVLVVDLATGQLLRDLRVR